MSRCFLPLIFCLASSLLLPCNSLEAITTEQHTAGLSTFGLLVQIITEPENLIRIFEGLNLGFQMLRSWGRTGSTLVTLPFNKDFLHNHFDGKELGPFKSQFYARVPTKSSTEAPRYIKVVDGPPKWRNDGPGSFLRKLLRRNDGNNVLLNQLVQMKTGSDLFSVPEVMSHRMNSPVIQLNRKKRSRSGEPTENATPAWKFPLFFKPTTFQNPVILERIEKVVDMLNGALDFLDDLE